MNVRELLAPSHFVSHVGSAVVAQGLLSAANFAVGLLLLRSAGIQPYAHYVLTMNTIALVVSLQTAFLVPPLSTRLPSLPATRRAMLIGGLLEEQRRLLRWGGTAAVLACLLYSTYLAVAATGGFAPATPHLLAVPSVLWGGLLVALCSLRREFLRQTLLALRRAHDILRADFCYALAIVILSDLLLLGLGYLGGWRLSKKRIHFFLELQKSIQRFHPGAYVPCVLGSTHGASAAKTL